MYFYLYDSFLQNSKYEKELGRLETRLTDLGIGGKIGKLNILQNAGELIQDAIKKGAQNIVVVGNDRTVSSILQTIAEKDAVLGYIPIGDGPFTFADMLGMPRGEAACEIISKRIIEKIDLGIVNGDYFLFYIEAEKNDIVIVSEKGYSIVPTEKNSRVLACNINYIHGLELKKNACSPIDGVLTAIVMQKTEKTFLEKFLKKKTNERIEKHTIIPFSRITFKSNLPDYNQVSITIDEHKVIKTPAEIIAVPGKLSMIAGRHRKM